MRHDEMLLHMREQERRKLMGRIVKNEVSRQGTVKQAAMAGKMSTATLYLLFDGSPKTSPNTLRSVEHALGLTDNLLDYILDGDIETIEGLPDAEIRLGLRRVILSGLERIALEGVEGNDNHQAN